MIQENYYNLRGHWNCKTYKQLRALPSLKFFLRHKEAAVGERTA